MAGVPPVPLLDIAQFPSTFQEWLRQLRVFVSSSSGLIPWSNVSKTGALLTDIPTRNHDTLQNISGGTAGSYFHLKTALKGSKLFDFASIASGAQATTTITVTGATTTSVVVIGYSSTPEVGIEFRAYVSAADTVTLEANNRTAGAIDPASRTYYVLVMDN